METYTWLAKAHIKQLVQGNYDILKRGGDSVLTNSQENLMADLNFFTMYSNLIVDYKNLLEQYDATSPDMFMDYHAVQIETTNTNALEFTHETLHGIEPMNNSYEDLKSTTMIYYIIFTIVNLLLTIIAAVIIYLMSDRITKDLNLMA